MQLGIFAKTFARSSLDAVKAHGIVCVQFNMSCAGLPTMPEEIPAELADRIRGEMDGTIPRTRVQGPEETCLFAWTRR